MMKTAALFALALAALTATCDAADVEAGKATFMRVCNRCHKVGPEARAAFGPQLNGIFGRKAGSTEDYNYTPEIKASGIIWGADTLPAFIKDPGAVVPGTRMSYWGISDDAKIADLLEFLKADHP